MSAVVKPGSVRIATSNLGDANVMYAAFANPDGSYALVLMNNNTQAKKITIDDGKNNFAYDVPAKSIISYRWKK